MNGVVLIKQSNLWFVPCFLCMVAASAGTFSGAARLIEMDQITPPVK
jgi:hypothetical protein